MSARSSGDVAAVLGAIAERSPLAMAATEGAAHLVRYANPAFCRVAGRAVEAVVGRPLAEAVPALQERAAMALLDRVYETGTPERAIDLGSARAGEMPTHETYAIWPILGDDHRPTGLLVQASDIPEQVRARDREAEAATEIRDANRRLLVAGLEAQEHAETQAALNAALHELLETREEATAEREILLARERAAREDAESALHVRDGFLSIAAHELRTPVASAKGTAQLALRALRRGALDEVRAERYLRAVVEAADRLEGLLAGLLDVSSMHRQGMAIRLAPMDFAALTRAVAQRYAEFAGDGHQLVTDVPEGAATIQGDVGRLEQVLDNLLSNAVKYSPGGGEIRVVLREADGGVVLTVRDAGIGLPSGQEERIFEPFGRATNARKSNLPGMGLGLNISRQIVEAHDGRIWAESAGEGQGATLGVWLPASPDHLTRTEQPAADSLDPVDPGERVDDDAGTVAPPRMMPRGSGGAAEGA